MRVVARADGGLASRELFTLLQGKFIPGTSK